MGDWYRQYARLNNARIGYSLILVLQIVRNPRHSAVLYFDFASCCVRVPTLATLGPATRR